MKIRLPTGGAYLIIHCEMRVEQYSKVRTTGDGMIRASPSSRGQDTKDFTLDGDETRRASVFSNSVSAGCLIATSFVP